MSAWKLCYPIDRHFYILLSENIKALCEGITLASYVSQFHELVICNWWSHLSILANAFDLLIYRTTTNYHHLFLRIFLFLSEHSLTFSILDKGLTLGKRSSLESAITNSIFYWLQYELLLFEFQYIQDPIFAYLLVIVFLYCYGWCNS